MKGVATLDDGLEVFVTKMGRADVADYLKSRKDTEDLRLLGVHRDSAGSRYLSVRDAVRMLRESQMDDWSLPGERATKEFVTAAVDSCGTLTVYDSEWARKSGVNTGSMVAHVHFILVEALRLALEVDQIDISNCRSFELIARRIIVDEIAVVRCPKSPDYAGLDLVFSAPASETGPAVTTKFTEWMASKLKERGNIMKQQRLWVEEDRLGRKERGKGLGKGKGDGDGPEKRRRPRAKGTAKGKEE